MNNSCNGRSIALVRRWGTSHSAAIGETERGESLMKALANALPSSMMLQTCALGIWLAWSFLAFNAGVWVDPSEANSSATSNVFIASTIGYAATCFACAMVPARMARLLRRKRLVVGAGLVASASCALLYLSGPQYLMAFVPRLAVVLSLSGAVLTGLGTSIIAARCMQMLSLLSPRRTWHAAASNILLSGALYFVALGTTRTFAIVVFCALPLCAAAMLACNPTIEFEEAEKNSEQTNDDGVSARSALDSRLFVRFCIMAFFLTMSLSIVRSESSYLVGPAASQSYSSVTMVLRMGIAFVLLFVILSLSKRAAFAKIYQSVLLAMVFVPLAFSIFSVGMAFTNIVLVCLYSFFELLIFCILAHLSASSETGTVIAFGKGWGAVTLGGLLGWLIGTYVPLIVKIDNVELILALLITICCVLVFVFAFTGKDLDDLVSQCIPDEEFSASPDAQKPQVPSFEEALASFADTYRLSARETDIARLVLRRTHPNEIADELYLSINTVRRHISNIYAKTDVHSRDELLKKFFGAASGLAEWETF